MAANNCPDFVYLDDIITVMRLVVFFLLFSIHAIGQNSQGLRFIQNKGQWPAEIDFQARVPGGRVGVSANGFSVFLLDMEALEHQHLENHHHINESNGSPANETVDGHYFRINLLGADQNAKATPSNLIDGHYNYFLGKDPAKWASNARAFETITYHNVYNGIDFRVSSVDNNLKYDFIVKPGADPSQIRLEYSGVDQLEKEDGELKIHTVLGPLTEMKPYSYQGPEQARQTVICEYRVDQHVASFNFPQGYDTNAELIIDPLLIFSTYSGSTADNWGSTATPGEHGTLYSAGVTRQDLGGAFPTTPGAFQVDNHGAFDMAIIKYDSAGTKFLYATLLGGVNNDSPQSLVVDKTSRDLLVLGISSSPDYPTGANSFDVSFNNGTLIFNRVLNTEDEWDIVLTRLSSNGDVLVGSTFLGGTGNDGLNLPKQSGGSLVANYGDEMRGDVITDEDGNVFISSVTSSSDFPIVNGFDNTFNSGITDGVIVKLSPDLSSIIWSSYIGGTGFDAAYSIKFDNDKNIVLAGGTTSTNFPVTPGSYQTVFKGIVDGWIARVSADGSSIMNATFTGTNSFDQVYFVDLNASGHIFCYGQTTGLMPVTAGVYNNPSSGQFLQKLSPDLGSLEFSTVFGSGTTNGLIIPNISPTAFLVNDCDNIYMSGWGGFVNSSPNTGFWQSSTIGMPITEDAYQKNTSGSDFYFIVLNGDATTLVYSTYLGGNSSKTHVDGGTSRFDKYGIVYHAVCSGCSFGNTTGRATSDFPTTPSAKSRVNLSQNCNNAAFKFDLSSLRAMFDTNNLALTMPGFNNVCYPDSIVFENFSTGGKTIQWNFDDGTIVNQDDNDPRRVIHQYKQAGQYTVKLKITDLSTCSQTDSTTKVINYFKDNIVVGEDAVICDGESFRLTASGGITYEWTSEDGTFVSSEATPLVTPSVLTTYYVIVVDVNGCSRKDTVHVAVTPNVRADFQTFDMDFLQPGFDNVCYSDSLRFKNLSTNGETFVWDFDDGTVLSRTKLDTVSIIHAFKNPGVYHVGLKAINLNTCNKADSVTKAILYFENQIEVGEDAEICEGTTHELSASGGTTYLWTTKDGAFTSSDPSPVVKPGQTTSYFVDITDSNGCFRRDTIEVAVLDSVDLQWEHQYRTSCTDLPVVFVRNTTPAQNEVTYEFDFGDGTITSDVEVEHVYEKDGTYPLTFSAQKKFCRYAETVQLPVYKFLVPNVFTPDDSPGYNDRFEIRFGPDLLIPQSAGIAVRLTVSDRWGKRVFESQDYRNDWNADGVAGGVYYIHVTFGDQTSCKGWLHIVK